MCRIVFYCNQPALLCVNYSSEPNRIKPINSIFFHSLNRLIPFLCLQFLGMCLYSQSISGYVYDEFNAPIPFANVYLKNTQTGTAADAKGRYYLQLNDPGVYNLVITSIGYENFESQVLVNHRENVVKNIWLAVDQTELNEVTISAKKRDPAYAIIEKAINTKEKWNHQFKGSSCEVYIKATEIISEKEKQKRERDAKKELKEAEEREEEDPFEAEKKRKQAEIKKIAGNRNMAEVQMIRYFQSPNSIKEIREGMKKYGNTIGLFYTSTNEADFNFYQNLMEMDRLNQLPVISPLHITSVLTYKFRLIESVLEEGKLIHKIEVIPRTNGNASWNGFIWIADSLFYIDRVDLSLSNEGLMIYSDFNIKQEFKMSEDSLLLLHRQEFDYATKDGRRTFQGNTIARYENYEINPTFEKRFFRNEVSVTTQEAYDRDTSYWEQIRPEPLTPEEQQYQHVKDSILAVTTSAHYLDSLDSAYNRITFLDVIWEGIGFTDSKKKQTLDLPSVPSFINPFVVGGARVGPYAYFFKKWKNEKYLGVGGQVDVGVRNMDFKGSINVRYRYDPMHLGYIGFYTGKLFNIVVQNDAFTFLFQRSNWIEEYRFNPYITREIVNGLEAAIIFEYVDRLPIGKYKFGPITQDWFGGNEPLTFNRYQAFSATLKVEFTPFRKYMTEPFRKVILGSKWPTFTAEYTRGVPNVFGSDINYDFAQLSISQTFKLRTFGTSSYHVKSGKFFNTQDLRYVDYAIFPRGDQYFFASLMQSMQIQDTTLYARDIYVQAHYVHHFNGAFMNLIPLINKLGVHTVVGASGLYIKDSGYQYGEWFVGAERNFKASRARWRLGIYYVDAASNFGRIQPRIKFAVNRYSLRDNSWGY
jgi:hypothetical protein